MRLLLHWLGLDSANGRPYLFYSGIGGDLIYLSAVSVLLRHVNCHETRCWRPARHHMGGYCRRHRKAA